MSGCLAMSAHVETYEWGSAKLDEGHRARVLLRALGSAQYAHYLIPALGLEGMTESDWADWLSTRGLLGFTQPPYLAATCYWDDARRQPTWEVSVRTFNAGEVEAECLVPTEPFRALMAWRGPDRGEIVSYAQAELECADIRNTRDGTVQWDGRGDELLVHLIDELLMYRFYQIDRVVMQAEVDDRPGTGGFNITMQSDHMDDVVEWRVRHAVAHLYEWTEHCQSVPWQRLSLDVKLGKLVEVELSAGYGA